MTIKKGQYVKSMNGISPRNFANRIGRVVSILNYDGNRDVVVLMMDEPGKKNNDI
jgi:UDP-N-acetylmuramyl pentapeptide synthase